MKITPYEIDFALAKTLEVSTPGTRLRNLAKKKGWILEAIEEPSRLHESVGLLNPSRNLFPTLISQLESLALENDNFRMFSIPSCSRMVQKKWDASPFHYIGEVANHHIMIQNAHQPFRLALSQGKDFPVMVRKVLDDNRLETVIQKMVYQFHPNEPLRTQFQKLLFRMAECSNTDFIEFILSKNNKIIGGVVLANFDIFCFPLYDFIEKEQRGKGLFKYILAILQKHALRKSTRYIIGDIVHEDIRPSLKRIFEGLGAKVLYSRCYYSMVKGR